MSTTQGFRTPMITSYQPPVPGRDEVLGPDGSVRPVWRDLLARLEKLTPEELSRRCDASRRLQAESGLAGDTDPLIQLPELNPLPTPISPAEWRELEAGLVQRATLFNEILADLYNQQMILRNGLLPPELVLGHAGFLRPAHGLRVPGNMYLHLYAADVVRTPDGRWVVVKDTAQAPRGMGIALENRIALLRMLPETYHGLPVTRLQPFFSTLRHTLEALSPRNTKNPRIVLLTPGPTAPAYVEHVYLARYLGFTLAEGSDLTVRDNRAYLKTLGGLIPVDVILRGVSDHMVDALELDYDSQLGVAGLVQAAHEQTVSVANALGSGLMESPALIPFLPELCRSLLGEDLQFSSVETIWGGNPQVEDLLGQDPARVLVRRVVPRLGVAAGQCRVLEPKEWHGAPQSLRREWRHIAVQRVPAASTMPVLAAGQLRPYALAMRFYLVATEEGYRVMPGGQARLAPTSHALLAHDRADLLGDLWVYSESPVNAPTLLQSVAQSLPLVRSGMDMPSRVADNLYWLGRYVERAEGAVRVVRAVISRLVSDVEPSELPELEVLVEILGALHLCPILLFSESSDELGELLEQNLLESISDKERIGALAQIVTALRRTAGIVRDRLSLDAWRIVNRMERSLAVHAEGDPTQALADALSSLNRLMVPLAAFSGMAMESMTRGPAWRFMDMGRRIERAIYMTTLLHATMGQAWKAEAPVLQALLEIGESSMTYRNRYLSSLQPAPALDLLLIDETNPRSIAFQMAAVHDHLEALTAPADHSLSQKGPEWRLSLALLAAVRTVPVTELVREDQEGNRPQLQNLLRTLEQDLPHLSDAIQRRYFSHLEPAQQMTGFWTPGGEAPQ